MEHGQFCKLRNSTIFGTYAGQVEDTLEVVGNKFTRESNTKSWFFDEELKIMVKVATKRLIPMERYK